MKLTVLVLISLIFTTSSLFADSLKNWSYKEWKTDFSTKDIIKYSTHGSIAYGNEFGFIKTNEDCGRNLLWLTIATYEEGLEHLLNQEVKIELDIDGEKHIITTRLTTVHPLTTSLRIAVFSNYLANKTFINLLKKGTNITFTIIGPQQILEKFDIPHETFKLNGFTAHNLKAEEICKSQKSESILSTPTVSKEQSSEPFHLNKKYTYSYSCNMQEDGSSLPFYIAKDKKKMLNLAGDVGTTYNFVQQDGDYGYFSDITDETLYIKVNMSYIGSYNLKMYHKSKVNNEDSLINCFKN